MKTYKERFIVEMLEKQQNNINYKNKLHYNDMKRISKYINQSIFHPTECCIWNGYITNITNNKGIYINFFFNCKKVALHRLLYINFIENLSNEDYIKFLCPNKGKCCNINHMKKFKYNKYCSSDTVEKDELITNVEKDYKQYDKMYKDIISEKLILHF